MSQERWPTFQEVVDTVVAVMNASVPTMSMYRDRQNGYPLTRLDVIDPSKQRLHSDARKLVVYILREHICVKPDALTTRRQTWRELNRLVGKKHSFSLHAKALDLLETQPEFDTLYRSTISDLLHRDYTLCALPEDPKAA